MHPSAVGASLGVELRILESGGINFLKLEISLVWPPYSTRKPAQRKFPQHSTANYATSQTNGPTDPPIVSTLRQSDSFSGSHGESILLPSFNSGCEPVNPLTILNWPECILSLRP